MCPIIGGLLYIITSGNEIGSYHPSEALEIKRRARIIALYKICTRKLHVAILRTAYALTATGVNPLAIGFTRALQWEIRFQSCVKSSTNRMLKRQKCKN